MKNGNITRVPEEEERGREIAWRIDDSRLPKFDERYEYKHPRGSMNSKNELRDPNQSTSQSNCQKTETKNL